MRTLRAKLFISVGGILLFVALMSYLFPELLVRRELKKATRFINGHFEKIQRQLLDLSSFLISYQLVNHATAYEETSFMVSKLVKKQKIEEPWNLAAQIGAIDPEISFVEVKKSNRSYVIDIQGSPLYFPKWIKLDNNRLLIEIPEKNQRYLAIPVSEEQGAFFYALYPQNILIEPKWLTFDQFFTSISYKDSIDVLYQALFEQKLLWMEKISLIQKMISVQHIVGMLRVDASFKKGACLLREDVFATNSLIGSKENVNFNLLIRPTLKGKEADLVSTMAVNELFIGIGFSFSNLLREVAIFLQKPLLLFYNNQPVLGFSKEGSTFDSNSVDFSKSDKVLWNNQTYIPYSIDLQTMYLMILTPEDQATAVERFLAGLKNQLSKEITLILFAAAFFSFLIALFLLGRISKRITQPISQLAYASEELGKGGYEKIILPSIEGRKDEVAVLTRSFGGMVQALKEREKIRGVLNKVVSKEIAEEILRSSIELKGEERIATIFFSDIRGFTHLSAYLSPSEVIEMLNDYLTHMCRIIDETKGVVDKFVGDEIMALYGVPLALENSAVNAIEAALRMRSELKKWNEEQKKNGKPPFEIGIGIHTGLVYSGNMGAENRQNYTVIGANVNLASRLCSFAKPMQILISEESAKASGVMERFSIQRLPSVTFKGIDHPVSIFEVI